MTGFVPPGCRTCHDALREMYEEKHGPLGQIDYYGWLSLFAAKDPYRKAKLNRVKRERLQAVVVDLQAQLYAGERVACWLGTAGLTDLGRYELSDKRGAVAISMGSVHPSGWAPDSDNTELLIREHIAVKPVKVANAKGGAPRKREGALVAYDEIYKDGHRATQDTQPVVARRVSAQCGFKVSYDTIDRALKERESKTSN